MIEKRAAKIVSLQFLRRIFSASSMRRKIFHSGFFIAYGYKNFRGADTIFASDGGGCCFPPCSKCYLPGCTAAVRENYNGGVIYTMKATGIVRRIDDLGRVVIPKEIRRTMRIREGDPLEIYTDADGEVIFKKYSPIGELSSFTGQYAEVLSRSTNFARSHLRQGSCHRLRRNSKEGSGRPADFR